MLTEAEHAWLLCYRAESTAAGPTIGEGSGPPSKRDRTPWTSGTVCAPPPPASEIEQYNSAKDLLPGLESLKVLKNGLQKAGQLVGQARCFDDYSRLGGVQGVGQLGQVCRVDVLHHGLQQAHHHQIQQQAVL